MEKTISIEYTIKDCRSCPFKTEVRDMNATFMLCDHYEAKGHPYARLNWTIREGFKSVPEWCPIGIYGT